MTNAGSEGTNRVIKTVARDAYGFRAGIQGVNGHMVLDLTHFP
ncbi:transposase [Microbispora hainanensis]